METIRIVVNGEERTVPPGLSLVDLILSLNLEPSRVAVELNREIVRREAWTGTVVASGARLEIVQFVGGG
jgi:thiamine biosynthesis protein ThiS